MGATIRTPWGPASELRERRLYPGGGTPPEEVARNQRERLFGAAVAVASEKGFEAMTVADLLALSGVSRSAFYKHFADKSDCLTAAAAQLLEPVARQLQPAAGNGRVREPRQVFEGFFELVQAEPAAARVCFVELHAAGEAGEQVADRAFEDLAQTVERQAGPPAGGSWDPQTLRALLGGIRKLVHSRLSRGEEAALVDLAPELWAWMTSVAPPPGPLEPARRARAQPGPRFEGYTPGERIARAVASVVAEKGYQEMTTDDIAAEAAISLSTFYAHFADKRDATLAALEMSGAQIVALAVPAARRAGHWEEGVRALYEAICAYFAAEPAMAQLTLVGVYAAGPRAHARRDRVLDSLAAMLAPAFAEQPEAPAVAAEAIAATVYALMRERARRAGPESLAAVVPLATYITLAGFVGPERALAAANDRARR
ncbi:MAG TPA: TetR/AcrR family transcriptional regulator [Solirubrobacterales bacterium]|nr:TetR/AcrR family transcriptional regulator [Solirubrobacterales bacterium]